VKDREFVNRISDACEARLEQADLEKLEAELASESQQAVRETVRHLVDEEPSLAWRSELNRRLAEAGPSRMRLVAFSFRPALGLGLAGALAVVAVLQNAVPEPTVESSPGIEAAMGGAHRQAVNARLVAGTGIYDYEARPTGEAVGGIVWEEADLRGP
jgi:hypothetical protein